MFSPLYPQIKFKYTTIKHALVFLSKTAIASQVKNRDSAPRL